MNKLEQAKAYHDKGYNCAQAVACTFAAELGFSEKTVFQLAEGFGFGMGTMNTCGAVTGMVFVVGMIHSDGNLDNPQSKHLSYRASAEVIKRFQDKNKSVICAKLSRGKKGAPLRSCDGCISDGVSILEEYLQGKK